MVQPTYVFSREGKARFSRSQLVKSLIPAGLTYEQAYSIAEKIRSDIKSKNITEITDNKIAKLVETELKKIKPEFLRRYSSFSSDKAVSFECLTEAAKFFAWIIPARPDPMIPILTRPFFILNCFRVYLINCYSAVFSSFPFLQLSAVQL